MIVDFFVELQKITNQKNRDRNNRGGLHRAQRCRPLEFEEHDETRNRIIWSSYGGGFLSLPGGRGLRSDLFGVDESAVNWTPAISDEPEAR